jgi:hypothetical protein
MFNTILIELYEKNTIKDIIRNLQVDEQDAEDLEQEIYMILLEYDNDKIIDMYNNKQLKYFIVGVIQRQYYSKTSPYYKKYKKYYSLVDENVTNNSEVTEDEFEYYDY